MTDSQTLLLVMALIYLSECATWTNLHCVAITSWTGLSWRWTRPGRWFGNRSGGLLPFMPLPPLGTAFNCQMWPLSLSCQGVLSNVSHALDLEWRPEHAWRYVPWSAVERVAAEEKRLFINGEYFCRTSSWTVTAELAELARTLMSLPEQQREAVICQALEAKLDTAAIFHRLEVYFRQSAPLRLLTNTLFSIVFLAAPVAVWTVGWLQCWVFLLVSVILAVLAVIIAFRGGHRALYPQGKYERRVHMAIMLLNPLSAIRAHDVISRDLLAMYHPLAVAQVLCSERVFRDLARRMLLDLRNPIEPACPHDAPAAVETEAWFRQRNVAVLERFLAAHAVDIRQLLAPDPPLDSNCLSYCPRCRCQFVLSDGQCTACGGIPLEKWPQEARTPEGVGSGTPTPPFR